MTIITVSRGTFSGGKTLAELLAGRLGYPCLSREEAVAQAAEEYGITKEDMDSAFNQPSFLWEQASGKKMAYLKCVTATILRYAEKGRLVYHGHAGHLLLRGISHVLRVRVLADREFRIEAAMERLGLNRDGASAHLDRVDNERRKWSRFLYGIDWENPELYDAVLNLERLTLDGACSTIIRMTELNEFKMTPASQRSLEDATLGSRVWAGLAKNEITRNASVRVSVDSGQVIIEGSVGSQKVVDAISRIAGQVEGIREIRNRVGIGTDWYW